MLNKVEIHRPAFSVGYIIQVIVMDNKIIAVAVVAVVVVAAVGAFVLLGNGGDDSASSVEGELYIYGNANGDGEINNKDVELLEKIKSGDEKLSDHPLADADGDKKITDKDIEIVKKIIAGEKTTVRILDQYDDVVTVDYPLRNVVALNSDMITMLTPIGGTDFVAGYVCSASYPVIQTKLTSRIDAVRLCDGRQLTADGWSAFTKLDASLQSKGQEIGAVLIMNDEALTDYKDDIQAAKIPIIHVRCTDPILSLDAALLFGNLFGGEYKDIAENFVTDSHNVLNEITKKIEGIKDKTPFIAMNMINYIAQEDSQYTMFGKIAGGKNVSGTTGTSSDPLKTVDAITIYDGKIKTILNYTTKDCVNADPAVMWEHKNIKYISNSASFKDMVFINTSMPTTCRVAYTATILYPDLFDKAWADDIFQSFVDKYMSYLDDTQDDKDFDVTKDMMTICTYQDYQKSKA